MKLLYLARRSERSFGKYTHSIETRIPPLNGFVPSQRVQHRPHSCQADNSMHPTNAPRQKRLPFSHSFQIPANEVPYEYNVTFRLGFATVHSACCSGGPLRLAFYSILLGSGPRVYSTRAARHHPLRNQINW